MENEKKLQFLTAKEVCRRLCVPLSTLYRLSKQGNIKCVQIGARWYYPESEIEKYLSCEPALRYAKRINTELPERRTYPRVNCHIECNFLIDLPQREENIYSVIKNIGAGGLLMAGGGAAQLEDPVHIEFILNSEIVRVKCRVVRKTENSFGVKFREIDKDQQEKIIKYVG